MPRKCFEPGGFVYEFLDGKCRTLAPNVAARTTCGRMDKDWRDVTWDEVMKVRRERQAERMERIRHPREPAVLPCYVWTFFNVQDIPYHGWYCYVVTRREQLAVRGKYGDVGALAESIMTEIPLEFLPLMENFTAWMAKFSKTYPRARRWPGGKVFSGAHRDPRQAGTFHGWLKDRKTFSIQHP